MGQIALVLSDPLQPYEKPIMARALTEGGLLPAHPTWTTEISPRHTPINTVAGGVKPGKRAVTKHRPALLQWIQAVRPTVVLVAGNEALETLCRVRPISAYRGKLLRGPFERMPGVEWVVPTFDMDTIRRTGFDYYPYTLADFARAVRASRGELRMMTLGEG